MDDEQLQEFTVSLGLIEIGWLTGVILRSRMGYDDPVSGRVWQKLKAAAIASGIEWHYGDPPWAKEQG